MVRSGLTLEFSTQEYRKIEKVEFGILSAEEIKAMSVCEITEVNYIDEKTRLPRDGGLADLRMGPCLKGQRCKTCDADLTNCPGHFGHMVLSKPVYHFGFLDIIKKVLSCVCYKCSRLKIPEMKKNDNSTLAKIHQLTKLKHPDKRLDALHKVLRGIKKCHLKKAANLEDVQMDEEKGGEDLIKKEGGCGAVQPVYKILKSEIGIVREFMEKPEGALDSKTDLSAEEVLKILQKISDEDCKILGFEKRHTRPESMIITVLPVAPPPVRPTVERPGGASAEDDLTYQYSSILKTNLKLKKGIETGEGSHVINDLVKSLQFYVTTLVKNEYTRKSTHKNGRPIKSIRARISGKEGRIRGNLMGKRVDFSARTVISPDPNLALDELGVPRTIAANLTFPEAVTKLNRDELEKLVRKDSPWTWPGAKYVLKRNGEQYDLRYAKEINLEYGDIVERHLVDGDYVLFNRQPSLHKMSMMAHRIRVLPWSSFRLNLSVTKPYNADFDGDEMNMHVPQTYETKAELKEIMHVPKQIVSPKANMPVMGIEQDTLVGIRLFTRREVFLELDQVMQLMMWLPDEVFDGKIPEPAILKPKKLWTGKQLLSLIIPKVNVERESSDFPKDPDMAKKEREEATPSDTRVLIRMGELLHGHVDKTTVGAASGGLIHTIWLDLGPEKTKGFLSDAQKLVNNWLSGHAFTVGVSDTIATKETLDKIDKILKEALHTAEKIWEDALGENKLEHQKGKSILDSFEVEVNKELNQARDKAGRELQLKIGTANNILRMVNAGSKGSLINLCQIIACVGQQNVEGKRIPFGFFKRTLPHFLKHDYSPRAKGFVENCYVKGLTPDEFFFHTMGGREGLIDTAVKTSETGYIQRKLVKAIEDVMVKYDMTVRDSRGCIVQFLYGEDGIAAEFIEPQMIDILEKSNEELEAEFRIKDQSLLIDELDDFMHKRELEQIKESRDELRRIFKTFEEKQYLPVNITRIIRNAKAQFRISNRTESDVQVSEAIKGIDELLKKLVIVQGDDELSHDSQQNATCFLRHYLRYTLSSKRVIKVHKLTKEAFNWVIGQIEYVFSRSRSHPGEMVGAIAAQSISEPTTQMTLNTFHFAGVSSKNVTLGVPRIKEIINKATHIKTPSLTIFLKDESYTTTVLKTVEYTTLRKLALRSQIFYDRDPQNSIITDSDSSYVTGYFEMPEEGIELKHISPWVLRVILNPDAMTDPEYVEKVIKARVLETISYSKDRIKILFLSNTFTMAIDKDEKPEIRLFIIRPEGMPYADEAEKLKKIEREILDEIQIFGINNVKKVYNRNIKKKVINPITGKLETVKETVFETDGTNLKEILALDFVDHRRTVSNDVVEVYKVLGIEAARQSLLNEIRVVLQAFEIYVNYRHLALLCDVMCVRGYIMPINRNGINRVDVGPLRKCSFEETLDMLLEAAAFSQSDPLTGISENVMLGQLCRLGTGYFDLVMDPKKLKEPKYIPDQNVEVTTAPLIDSMSYAQLPSTGLETPNQMNTPGPIGNYTPTPRTTAYDDISGAFTPGPTLVALSPGYTTPRVESPGTLGTAGYFSPYMASPIHRSPVYMSGISYSPASPHYSSPSMGSSASGSRVNSPSSPSYSIISPRYSPSYSPRSPNYTSTHSSNTPSSQAHKTQTYSQSPAYTGGIYNPVSPAYEKSTSGLQPVFEKPGEDSQEEEEEEEKTSK